MPLPDSYNGEDVIIKRGVSYTLPFNPAPLGGTHRPYLPPQGLAAPRAAPEDCCPWACTLLLAREVLCGGWVMGGGLSFPLLRCICFYFVLRFLLLFIRLYFACIGIPLFFVLIFFVYVILFVFWFSCKRGICSLFDP